MHALSRVHTKTGRTEPVSVEDCRTHIRMTAMAGPGVERVSARRAWAHPACPRWIRRTVPARPRAASKLSPVSRCLRRESPTPVRCCTSFRCVNLSRAVSRAVLRDWRRHVMPVYPRLVTCVCAKNVACVSGVICSHVIYCDKQSTQVLLESASCESRIVKQWNRTRTHRLARGSHAVHT